MLTDVAAPPKECQGETLPGSIQCVGAARCNLPVMNLRVGVLVKRLGLY